MGFDKPKTIFYPPFSVARCTTVCPECMQQTPVVGVLAAGFVPVLKGNSDIANIVKNDIHSKTPGGVHIVYCREYPGDFLKKVRPYNFMFRWQYFGDDEWTEDSYFANLCQHCLQPINDFSLYYEPDGCFSRENPYTKKALFPLKWNAPLVVDAKFA